MSWEREEGKVELEGIVSPGTRVSLVMVAKRANEEDEETSSLKADLSSVEALMPDCMVGCGELALGFGGAGAGQLLTRMAEICDGWQLTCREKADIRGKG